MGKRHHSTQEEGVAQGAAAAYQVSGDDGFSVPRRQSMHRAQLESHAPTAEKHTEADLAAMQHSRDRIAAYNGARSVRLLLFGIAGGCRRLRGRGNRLLRDRHELVRSLNG